MSQSGKISKAWVHGWSVFCYEECCLLWISFMTGVAAACDAVLPVFTKSSQDQIQNISATRILHSLSSVCVCVCAYIHMCGLSKPDCLSRIITLLQQLISVPDYFLKHELSVRLTVALTYHVSLPLISLPQFSSWPTSVLRSYGNCCGA